MNNRSPVQILVRAFLIILFLLQDFPPVLLSWSLHQRLKCEKKCGSSNFCKINFVYLLLGSADRVQTKINFTFVIWPWQLGKGHHIIIKFNLFQVYNAPDLVWIYFTIQEAQFRLAFLCKILTILCSLWPTKIGLRSPKPSQLYNQPSLVWIHKIGGRQAFGQTWPSDLENRAMVTKINYLFPPSLWCIKI